MDRPGKNVPSIFNYMFVCTLGSNLIIIQLHNKRKTSALNSVFSTWKNEYGFDSLRA